MSSDGSPGRALVVGCAARATQVPPSAGVPGSRVELQEVIGARQKELLMIPAAGHNDLFVRGLEQYMPAVQAFVGRERQ